MLEKLNYKFLSLFLISITTVNFLFFTYRFFNRQNGYILGDWLINYEGGFTRRGLAGHLFIKINEIFNLSLTTISYIFLLIIFVILFIFLIKLIKKSKLNFLVLLLIYSPANFLFTFFDPLATGRKEILFYLFFCLYLFYREKKIFIYLSPILGLFILLIHELFVFIIPFFFVARYFQVKNFKTKSYYFEIFLTIICLLTIILISYFSDPITRNTCNAILQFGYNGIVCLSINDLNLISDNIQQGNNFLVGGYIKGKNYITYYFIFFLLTTCPIFLCITKFKTSLKLAIFFLLITFLPLLLLFFIVNDWGRYMHIYSMLWMLTILYFNKFEDDLKINIKKILILLLFSTSWYMPHCCPDIHFSKYKFKPSIYYIYERIAFRVFNKI